MPVGPVLEPRVATVSAVPGAVPEVARGAATPSSDAPSPFARLVRGLGREVQRGESLMRGAIESTHGGDLGPAELIALQAGVYRYSEAVDLAAKLVDHATSGLKTVVQGQ